MEKQIKVVLLGAGNRANVGGDHHELIVIVLVLGELFHKVINKSGVAQELMTAAARALKYGGDFYLVHRPERLGDIIARAAENGLEAKRLLLVRHRPESDISIIALQLRKGGKPGLMIEEACLNDSFGLPTEFYRDVYHLD